MRDHKLGIILSVIVVVSSFLLVAPASAGGIGVAPSRIKLTEALRGGEYRRTVYVMNPGDQKAEYVLSVEGEAAGWISFYADEEAATPIERIVVPPDGRSPLVVKFAIAGDAANRTYEAKIVVASAPPETTAEEQESSEERSGGAVVLMRASVQVIMEITGTQILAGEVTGVLMEDTELNYPLRAMVHFRNTGNVVARPNISVEIRKGDEVVKSLSFSDQSVDPDAKEVIRVEDETAGMSDGEYQATVVVSLGDEVLITKELSFKLLPVGTLSRDGKLVSMTTEGDAVADWVLKILATFANTGEIETPAQLVAEVYRDGALLGVQESRELLVLPRERAVLKAYLQLSDPGDYTIKGQVHYGGKLTEVSELSFKVISPPQAEAAPTAAVTSEERSPAESAVPSPSQPLVFGLGRQTAIYIAFLAAIVVAAGFLIWSLVAARRKKGASKAS